MPEICFSVWVISVIRVLGVPPKTEINFTLKINLRRFSLTFRTTLAVKGMF